MRMLGGYEAQTQRGCVDVGTVATSTSRASTYPPSSPGLADMGAGAGVDSSLSWLGVRQLPIMVGALVHVKVFVIAICFWGWFGVGAAARVVPP